MPPSLESQRHSPAAAYLRHLQQKNQNANNSKPSGKTSRTCSSNSDHRQTIVSPVAHERNVFHPPPTSPVPSKSPVTLHPTNSSSNRSTSNSPPAALSNKPKKRTSSSRKNGKKSRSGHSSKTLRAKPPLFNSKHPRSVISETTNSTYLSSDSEEEDATVESDSHHSCSVQSGISIRSGRSGHSSNPEQQSIGDRPESSSASVDASSALVPYQQQPQEEEGQQPHQPQYHHHQPYLSSSHRPVVSTDYEDDLADAFQYSDGEDDHVAGGGAQALQEVISDDTTTSDDSDTLADLDQLIAESSARWKHTVHSTLQNTVTAKTVGSLVSASQQQLQQQLAQQQQHHHHQRHFSDVTASPGELLPSLMANGLHISNSTSPNSMEEQQPQSIQQPLLPVQHILEPATSHGGGGEVDDEELTVWSGFHSTVHRPDAASVAPSVQDHHHPHPSVNHQHPSSNNNHNDDVLQQQHRQVVEVSGRTLELQSSVSGVTRRAVFSGTMLMVNNNNHLDESSSSNDEDGDADTTTSITGTGVLQFVETGDVYRGSLVESEMHGRGTYTFAATGKTLQGVFEHNVYVG